ncbi:UDP-N-acetylmuramate--L-alanine ligase [Phormidium tenue]|jgi:UDP-N-acetylmuramate--alanine ligase|uniref:UDP-N-acetylmuramate--L-alanine ligase n=1 Tax=Phormidium tenue FACHB-1050 TaxID=2692857 RepID=A0ABR8CHS6_9CYAN|nr:UDP-N-acetylmuramate--L-alanine ligase [Phormidium tenue]MBD2319915.1 UDP-N-acetylmuramate--L-alanine ligase [Phormidium tenue FACHB-1050]
MLNPVDFSGRPFHFVGIGGIGMSAIAYILAKQGFTVSGSDLSSNRITQKLQDLGVKIFQGHHADNIDLANAPQVVCSTAINQQNPEFQVALANGLPILHRSDLLAALIEQFQAISVAGTHGKTTTSSLVGFLLLKGGIDPSIIIGGEVSAWQGNARLGNGKYLVAEADESDGTLVKFLSHIGIVTNIELDHPDHYHNLEQVIEIFQTFAKRCEVVVGSIDCPTVKQHIRLDITYSLSDPLADYTVTDVQYNPSDTQALVIERGKPLGLISLGLLGKHNLSNALAAIAVARYVGVEWNAIADALPDFVGASRRFEIKGVQNRITFVDDYAHHPSEIIATLASARQQNTTSRVVAIFQPHRYSRTHRFLSEFSHSFTDADMVIVTDIYAASEPNDGKITGSQVAEAIASVRDQVHYLPTLKDVQAFLVENLQSGDLAVFLGAGNLNQAIAPTMKEIEESLCDSSIN